MPFLAVLSDCCQGLVNFLGLLGTGCRVVLAVYALPQIRRRCYEWFYAVHIPVSEALMPFCCASTQAFLV